MLLIRTWEETFPRFLSGYTEYMAETLDSRGDRHYYHFKSDDQRSEYLDRLTASDMVSPQP